MAQVVPIRWLGPTRASAIESELSRRVAEWLQGWVPSSLRATLQRDDGERRPALEWVEADGGAGVLSIGYAPDVPAQLGASLAGCEASGARDFARAVGSRALVDLAVALSAASITTLAPVSDASARIAARAGGAVFKLAVGGMSILVHVDAVLAAAVSPPAVASGRLVTRRDALAATGAALEVTLALGNASLDDLIRLQPGDVLRTNVRVGGFMQLATPDGTIVRTGHLAADGEHRAIRIQ